MLMEDYKYLFKVVLIGNASVGKTCLVRRFCQNVFPAGQAATIGVDFLIKTVEVDGEKIKVNQNEIKNELIFSTKSNEFHLNLATNLGYGRSRTISIDHSIILSIGQCSDYCF